MGFTSMGGGIMVALAAGLWLVYLMPSWFKRREYIATERTEVRRQQAIRVLQETAPTPAIKRVESIVSPTGQVTDRDKLTEAIRRSRDAQAARVTNRTLVEQASPPARDAFARARLARRLRRTRALASLLLFAAVIVAIVQLALMITTGIAVAAWTVLGFSAVAGVVAVAALGRLASIARRRAAAPAATAPRKTTSAMVEQQATEHRQSEQLIEPAQDWTPVPVPKPMYLSRTVAPIAAEADPMEQLRAAARAADRALREAHDAPEVVPIVIPEREAPPSRYALMGIVDELDATGTDLDEVLRRRRA